MALNFSSRLNLDDTKTATKNKEIEKMKGSELIHIPLVCKSGNECEPIVKAGELVTVGQKIGDTKNLREVPVHSSVSGKVKSVAPKIHSSGAEVMTITIENDFLETVCETNAPKNYEEMSQEEVVIAIREAGIIGHGGGEFPAHAKISLSVDQVETIIINATECEPYITADYRLLVENANEIIGGAKIIKKVLDAKDVTIAVNKKNKSAFAGLNQAITDAKITAQIKTVSSSYGQGFENNLIRTLEKKTVAKGQYPTDVNCVVFNVGTLVAIYNLFNAGTPDISRVVTVSGSAIANPKNISAPIGTTIGSLIECAGGFIEDPNKIVMGGPLMGTAQFSLDVPISAGTNGVLAFCKNEDKRIKNPACLRCGKCVSVCPIGLSPVHMNLYANKGMVTEFEEIGGTDCIECGACSYVCPARIQLVQQFKTTKQKVADLVSEQEEK
ncbi:MAG: electron transport complex subunit RsxC [Clostridia bacterium]